MIHNNAKHLQKPGTVFEGATGHLKGVKWFPRNRVWAQIGTFLVVTIGWVFFKPPTFEASWTILKKMFDIPGLFASTSVQPALVGFILIAGDDCAERLRAGQG
jgi:D-alanyl-lipoteichoic acid acyltransferase DltB (MBOAT superfamily)